MSDVEKHDQPVTVLLSATMKRDLNAEAYRRGIPISTLLRVVVRDWLAEQQSKGGAR